MPLKRPDGGSQTYNGPVHSQQRACLSYSMEWNVETGLSLVQFKGMNTFNEIDSYINSYIPRPLRKCPSNGPDCVLCILRPVVQLQMVISSCSLRSGLTELKICSWSIYESSATLPNTLSLSVPDVTR